MDHFWKGENLPSDEHPLLRRQKRKSVPRRFLKYAYIFCIILVGALLWISGAVLIHNSARKHQGSLEDTVYVHNISLEEIFSPSEQKGPLNLIFKAKISVKEALYMHTSVTGGNILLSFVKNSKSQGDESQKFELGKASFNFSFYHSSPSMIHEIMVTVKDVDMNTLVKTIDCIAENSCSLLTAGDVEVRRLGLFTNYYYTPPDDISKTLFKRDDTAFNSDITTVIIAYKPIKGEHNNLPTLGYSYYYTMCITDTPKIGPSINLPHILTMDVVYPSNKTKVAHLMININTITDVTYNHCAGALGPWLDEGSYAFIIPNESTYNDIEIVKGSCSNVDVILTNIELHPTPSSSNSINNQGSPQHNIQPQSQSARPLRNKMDTVIEYINTEALKGKSIPAKLELCE